ncbi:MAG: NADH-quinone oxidoreductase subunit L, partial [Alphaproteobacteria bacterium]|nr:NADH-quinone oxidoreductase subunit L [Alphaproteobacteria bacterium]
MFDLLINMTIFLPLFGFLLSQLLKKDAKNHYAPLMCTTFMAMALLAAVLLVNNIGFGEVHQTHLWTWFKVKSLKAEWGFYIDTLSLTMILVVCCVSTLVHLYSFGYMHNDKEIGKFFSYLSFFTFAMLVLVCSPNLLQLFAGWEAVGLASYLLIGFWYDKENPPAAAMKAFIVNRVGDVGLVAGIGLLFYIFNTIDIPTILQKLPLMDATQTVHFFTNMPIVNAIGLCFLLAVMGKSAQFGLHVWLPDAMEGPTPVSALIHAATMVTAGIFLICRFSALFELTPHTQMVMLMLGALTSIFAGIVACTQTDIKKIIAYSTCSQLGYM